MISTFGSETMDQEFGASQGYMKVCLRKKGGGKNRREFPTRVCSAHTWVIRRPSLVSRNSHHLWLFCSKPGHEADRHLTVILSKNQPQTLGMLQF